MKSQLIEMGFDFDWECELSTSDEKYYKHTQQLFNSLFEDGLATKQ